MTQARNLRRDHLEREITDQRKSFGNVLQVTWRTFRLTKEIMRKLKAVLKNNDEFVRVTHTLSVSLIQSHSNIPRN